MALTVDVVLAGIKEIVVEVAGIDAGIIAMDTSTAKPSRALFTTRKMGAKSP
jgi:hypothetical protein